MRLREPGKQGSGIGRIGPVQVAGIGEHVEQPPSIKVDDRPHHGLHGTDLDGAVPAHATEVQEGHAAIGME